MSRGTVSGSSATAVPLSSTDLVVTLTYECVSGLVARRRPSTGKSVHGSLDGAIDPGQALCMARCPTVDSAQYRTSSSRVICSSQIPIPHVTPNVPEES